MLISCDERSVCRGGSRTCRRRGRRPLGGRRPNIFIHFLKNPMKLKKFWSVGGRRAPGAHPPPPKSATGMSVHLITFSMQVFHINFWLNISHINYSSKMDIFVLNLTKTCNYKVYISFKFSVLSCQVF